VLKVISDILDAGTLAGFRDMSPAFDAIDDRPRDPPSSGCGLWCRTVSVSKRFSGSFLTDRSQTVVFAGFTIHLLRGVFYVAFPAVYPVLSADVTEIAARHGVCIHAYADDLQVYASCAAFDQQTATDRLSFLCRPDLQFGLS